MKKSIWRKSLIRMRSVSDKKEQVSDKKEKVSDKKEKISDASSYNLDSMSRYESFLSFFYKRTGS